MKRVFLIVFFSWSLFLGKITAQDPVFSMPFVQTLFTNPAFAGSGNGRLTLGFRDQMPGSPARYITSVAGWDQPFEVLHGGAGVLLMHDMAGGGTLSTTGISAVYSYHLKISKDLFLDAGFQASVFQSYLNTSGLILPDMISPSGGITGGPREIIPPERKIFPDFSIGFLLFSDRWFTSVAAHHLMEPYQSVVRNDETVLPRKYSLLGGYILEKKQGDLIIYPWAGIMKQGIAHRTLLGFQMKYLMTAGGIAWNKNFGNGSDILIFSFGIVTKRFRITYSYDAYLGKIAVSAPGGAHEIGVVVGFGNEKSSYRGAIKWPLM